MLIHRSISEVTACTPPGKLGCGTALLFLADLEIRRLSCHPTLFTYLSKSMSKINFPLGMAS